ncbi:MAG TPA: hypothetical protein VF407_13670, partial [Polyangiaceae bacterium]
MPPRKKIISIAKECGVLAFFVLCAIAMTWPLLPHARDSVADMGVDDVLLYTRYSRCFRDWLLGRAPGYLSFDMYFPSLLSGATDDAGLGIAAQVLPLSLFVRDWLFSVNLVTFASFVMCAHATYLLVREITTSRAAGIVSGVAFAFCFYRMRQLDHPHVLQMQWLPYALYFLHRLAAAPTQRNAVIFGLSLFAAEAASFNVAIYSAFVFPAVGAWLVVTTRKDRLRLIGWLAIVCAVTGVLLYFVYRPFFILRDAGGPLREAWEIKQFSSKLESFHAAPAFSKNYGDLSKHMSDECATFLGWVVLGLASVGLFGLVPKTKPPIVAERSEWLLLPFGAARAFALAGALLVFAFYATFEPLVRQLLVAGALGAAVIGFVAFVRRRERTPISPAPVYVAVALVYAAFCFGLEVKTNSTVLGEGVWKEIQTLPGFEQVRTPSRFFLVSSLCAAILAGIGTRTIASALPWKIARAGVFALATFGVLWDLRTEPIPLRKMPTEATAPPVYRALATAPKPGAVLELPVEWSQRERRPVYYAAIHGRPEVNGVSGWGQAYFNWLQPGAYTQPSKFTDGMVGIEALEAAHVAGLRYVVVHRSWFDDKNREIEEGAIVARGAQKIGTYDDDDLWELPDPPPSRPAKAADVEVRFVDLTWREKSKREVFVNFAFVNRTGDELYERVVKHFRARATAANAEAGKGDCYFLPPLLPAHGDFPTRCRMVLAHAIHDNAVDVELTDDDGT